MKYIFIDTNIFLHFQEFEKINWLEETSSDKCKLIISPIVIDELDKAKKGNSSKSKRAKKVLDKFENFSENNISQINQNIYFEILNSKPNANIYDQYELNFEEQDHRLFASMITYRNSKKVEDISICTDDIGPRLRARQYDFGTIKLNEKYRLPSQDSETEKKIKRLELENEQLKNRIPKLRLGFMNNQEFMKIVKGEKFSIDFIGFQNQELKRIENENPLINPQEYVELNSSNFLSSFNSLSSTQIEQYNKDLKKYYKKYEKYLISEFEYVKKSKLSYELFFQLENYGTIPAKDIDIHLHFPDGFELIESSKIKGLPNKPKLPYKPKNKFDFGLSVYPQNRVSPVIQTNSISDYIDSPNIKKTNSYDVDYHKPNLKHGYTEKLNSLTVIFENYKSIKNFQIGFELSAENIPTIIIGKLNVIFE